MTTPADIFGQALERMSPTNLFMREPEGEPIRLGGTMLEPANDGDLSAEDLAGIDREFGIEEDRAIEADLHNNRLKNSGALERRRIERTPLSIFERQARGEWPV